MQIRKSTEADREVIFRIINDGAQRYRGVIPDDRWHDPYMPADALTREIADGVEFWIAEEDSHVLGVMGIQDKREVTLIRHAYVATDAQRKGVGTQLLKHAESMIDKPILIGTWADASWAIDFYRRNGYTLLTHDDKERLLRTYWSIPEEQVATSVVLADQRWRDAQTQR